jgi:hypothetical protein
MTAAMATVARPQGPVPFQGSTAPVGRAPCLESVDANEVDEDGGVAEEDQVDPAEYRCSPAQLKFALQCREKNGNGQPFRHEPPPLGIKARQTPESFQLHPVIIW